MLPATPSLPWAQPPELAASLAPLLPQAQLTLVQVGEGLLLLLHSWRGSCAEHVLEGGAGRFRTGDVGRLFLLQVGQGQGLPARERRALLAFCPVHPIL